MRIKNLKIIPIVSIVLLIIVSLFCKPSSVEGASVVWTDKDIYNQGEIIRVNFTNAPGNYNDWICIVPVGSPDTDGGDWKYIPSGLRQGVLIFDLPSPGQYEVRAYYNYYRNGYVVTGRYAFLVVNDFVEATPPPPLPFDAPPDVIVMPDTNDVYVVPGIDVDLFFWSGWWWRPWGGHWYRSLYYNHGWGYYNAIPSFYYDVDPGWRGYYRDRNWYGHRWDYERIPHHRLQQNWKSWQNDRHWERQGTWGVRNYQPRPQQQRQELRQQRQQQYQQRSLRCNSRKGLRLSNNRDDLGVNNRSASLRCSSRDLSFNRGRDSLRCSNHRASLKFSSRDLSFNRGRDNLRCNNRDSLRCSSHKGNAKVGSKSNLRTNNKGSCFERTWL